MIGVPEGKRGKRSTKIKAFIVAIIGLAATITSFIFGMSLLVDKNDLLGIIPLAAALLLSVLQITLGIKAYNRRNK